MIIKFIFKNKVTGFIFWLIIPLVYLGTVMFSVFRFVSHNYGWLNISLPHPQVIKVSNIQILEGRKLTGAITAFENNLGSMSFRFYNFDRINNDILVFRIKEKEALSWYYENYYKVDQFQPDQLFPFGFPPIKGSKNKQYSYEIESLQGKHGDAIAISRYPPQITTKYLIDRSHRYNIGFLLYFLFIKWLNLLVVREFLYYFIARLFPLVVYFLCLYILFKYYKYAIPSFEKFLNEKFKVNRWLWALSSGMILLEILFIRESNDLLILLMMILLVLTIQYYKIKSNMTFLLTIPLIIIYPIFFMVGRVEIAEKMAIWGYLLLFIGVFQQLCKELKLPLTKLRQTLSTQIGFNKSVKRINREDIFV